MPLREPAWRRSTPLRRAQNLRRPLAQIEVWTEGENTEAGWIDHLIQRSTDLAIHIRIDPHPGQGVPKTLVKKAKASRPKDVEVWVVFDRDEHDLTQALVDARDAGVGIVFSHACFELWPLLHVRDHSRPEGRGALQRALHEVHPAYHHGLGAWVEWDALATHVEAATSRALRLHARSPDLTTWTAARTDAKRPTGVFANPSTTAWLLHARCLNPSFAPEGDDPFPADHPLVEAVARNPRLEPLLDCLPHRLRERARAGLRTARP